MPPSTAESARARKSIESDFPIIAVPISVTTTMNQFTAALGIPNRDSTRKGAALIEDSYNASFDNIHLDLMYDLPEQTLDTFLRSVQIGSKLPICHISAYRLYVFKYGTYHKAGFSPTLHGNTAKEDKNAKKMIETASDILSSAGFNQYSLKEFAREGKKNPNLYWIRSKALI
jgi:oxygen-independent coproporphyrinogen-3 oxidase